MKKALIALVALLPFTTNSYSKPVTYDVDTQGMHASINFKVNHLGYSWLTGRFEKFSGTFVYDNERVSNSNIQIEIQTKSVNSNHAERDKHLKGKEFLNVKKHPVAKFESTSISEQGDKLAVNGKFTLNGVTKAIRIEAEKIGEGKDPWGGYRAGFSGSTQLKLADYNITKNLGPASTHVLLELHIEGIRKK